MSRFAATPVSIFDRPEVALSMALDGELTARGLWDVLADPAALSPSERDGIAARIKRSLGDDPFTGALTDIALNPFAWFFFLTSPAGASAIGHGAKGLFNVSRSYSRFINKNSTLLQTLKLTTGGQELRGGASPAALAQTIGRINQLRTEETLVLGKQYEAMLKRAGAPHLDWQAVADPVKRKNLQELNALLFAKFRRMHETTVEVRAMVGKKGKTVPPKVKRLLGPNDSVTWENVGEISKRPVWIARITRAPRVREDPTKALRAKFGQEAVDFANSAERLFKQRGEAMFGRAGVPLEAMGAGERAATENRLYRIWRLAQNPAIAGKLPSEEVEGYNILKFVMGPSLELTNTGKLPFDQWKKLAFAMTREPLASQGFFPVNVMEAFDRGKNVERFFAGELYNAVKPRGAINRAITSPAVYHPDDLRMVGRLLGGTRDLAVDAVRGAQRLRASDSKLVRLARVNVQRSLSRYAGDTSRVLALSDEPGEALWEANRRATKFYESTTLSRATGLYDPPFGGVGASMRTPARDLGASGPAGGVSVADLIQADAAHLQNPHALERLVKVLVPRATGAAPMTQTAIYRDLLLWGKSKAVAFADTSLGKALSKGGGYSQRFVDGLRIWGEQALAPGEVGHTSAGLAKLFYVSHLGFNPFSVLINLTQPLGPAATWLGFDNLAAGYKNALEDMGAYLGKRASEGFKRLTPAEYNERIKSSFRITQAGPVGDDDLVGILARSFETLEGQQIQGGVALSRKAKGLDLLTEVGLKAFQKAEWFNRVTTGYAYLNWAKKAGMISGDELAGALGRSAAFRSGAPVGRALPGRVQEELRQVVQETQFGADIMNVPFVFQPGQVLGNPVMRQFASFITRSFTAPFAVGPQIGEGARYFRGTDVRVPLPASLVDFGRLAGFSAIVYEGGKNLIGADLMEFTPFAAATEAVPFVRGGRFDEHSTIIPVPPVIDVPSQTLIALGTEDVDLLRRQFGRVIPGGVGARRLTPVLQSLFHPVPGVNEGAYALTRVLGGTYADYENPTPEGMVPVFKGDGTLLSYQTPSTIIFRGLGVPVREETAAELDHMIVKNIGEITQYQRRYIDAVANGRQGEAQAIQQEFGKRYQTPEGFPLPLAVSKEQVRSRQQLSTVARTERMLDRVNPQLRQLYVPAIEEAGEERLGLPPGGLRAGMTARSRRGETAGQSGRIDRVGPEARREAPFGSFGSFGGFVP